MNRRDSKRKSQLECQGPGMSATLGAVGKGRLRQNRRRMTCPNPREITKVMATMVLGPVSKGCSLDELLEKCILSFDPDGSLCCSDNTVNMALTMHSWVLPSAEFARRLLALYQEATGEKQGQRRLRICNLIRYWVNHFPEAFRLEPQLDEVVGGFWNAVRLEGDAAQRRLMDSANLLSPEDPQQPQQLSSPSCGKKRKVSLLFDHLETGELAEHLTYLEFKAFCGITASELRSYVLQGSVRENPALERSVALCNSVSQWVQVMVLSRPTPQQRAEVLTKFIHVAQKLRQLHNFNTLMAVTGGLCHSAISRLKDSHALLSPDSTKTLLELAELLASGGNYGQYRRAFGECGGFKLPVLGVHLKDLVSLHEALPDRLPDGRLHLPKLQGLYRRLQELQELQRQCPPCSANKDLLHLLTLSLDLFYTEDEIYELSYAREPRNPKSLPPTPFKPPLVVEWAPGVTPKPDRDTLSRHVEQLVESVFKNYDPEGRGYVSRDDFECIAASFPFACHDLHRAPHRHAGPFSREELTGYFLKASAICAKLGLGFLHAFHEVTFKKPTFCDSCNGFLWGVSKQGFRCRDCGLSCHRQCKDQVEVECKKQGGKGDGGPTGSLTPYAPVAGSGSEDGFSFPASGGPGGGTQTRHAWTQTDPLPPGSPPPEGHSAQLLQHMKDLEQERERLLLENMGLRCANAHLESERSRQRGPGEPPPAGSPNPVTLILADVAGAGRGGGGQEPRPGRARAGTPGTDAIN
ncbi:RAS guanyl-releasing protein 4 isoform X1 [Ornithorhynchus anatinus]|uniref:RAS guanyl-releasing protein 4 isoform X1 n=2 Tax=Ornithorhynchus anatinus TaxID=9258 RepID=UPI0010A8A5E4|nr:RAS guanyl-releasing protein 4 isoform X1 [Ornithorhynchus anatinus]